MFFEKPNIKYVDMCIYIDDNVYTDKCDHELVYKYLYHIILMIVMKRRYFSNSREAENFSLYAASHYYMRLTDNRQFKDENALPHVRSVLNYIKKTLFSVKYRYHKKYTNCNEVLYNDSLSIDVDAFTMYTNSKIDELDSVDFKCCLGVTNSFIKEYLKTIPYPQNTPMWNNIYISCMLSFLNSITLRNRDLKRIGNFKRPNSCNDVMLNKLYMEERYSSTILYHLDDSMYNYITVLTNRIRHKMAKELSHSLHSYTSSYIMVKNLLMSNMIEDEVY